MCVGMARFEPAAPCPQESESGPRPASALVHPSQTAHARACQGSSEPYGAGRAPFCTPARYHWLDRPEPARARSRRVSTTRRCSWRRCQAARSWAWDGRSQGCDRPSGSCAVTISVCHPVILSRSFVAGRNVNAHTHPPYLFLEGAAALVVAFEGSDGLAPEPPAGRCGLA
jgi:hypothetical protein